MGVVHALFYYLTYNRERLLLTGSSIKVVLLYQIH